MERVEIFERVETVDTVERERERERERATLYLICNLINCMHKNNLINKIETRQVDL